MLSAHQDLTWILVHSLSISRVSFESSRRTRDWSKRSFVLDFFVGMRILMCVVKLCWYGCNISIYVIEECDCWCVWVSLKRRDRYQRFRVFRVFGSRFQIWIQINAILWMWLGRIYTPMKVWSKRIHLSREMMVNVSLTWYLAGESVVFFFQLLNVVAGDVYCIFTV